jgi:hypothetical protein
MGLPGKAIGLGRIFLIGWNQGPMGLDPQEIASDAVGGG